MRAYLAVLAASLIVSLPALLRAERADKIPITTTSPEALEAFLAGRGLSEKLRAQEARSHFERAIEQDSAFALAYLYNALSQNTTGEFFAQLDSAVARVDAVSEGEKDWILGLQAGAVADPLKQLRHYQRLVAAYPNDERAHNLLGNHWFGQQAWDAAIEAYERAITINPGFTQSYNQLGYARRFLGDFEGAEKAFTKYIALIPDDPNPYDSYAELLMTTGRYEESLLHYRKALDCDPRFVASHMGIANDLNLLGRHAEARSQMQVLLEVARDDGERRGAHFATAVSFLDEGRPDDAIVAIGRELEIATKMNDAVLAAGDHANIGSILLATGRVDEARQRFEAAYEMIQKSDLSDRIKTNSRVARHYNAARVAIAGSDWETAQRSVGEFEKAAEPLGVSFFDRQANELRGTLALARGDHEAAITHLTNSNQQDPYNVYRIGLAYARAGDRENARIWLEKAATFNALNNLNYAIVRHKAGTALDALR